MVGGVKTLYAVLLALMLGIGCGMGGKKSQPVPAKTVVPTPKQESPQPKGKKPTYFDVEPLKALAEKGDVEAQDNLGFRYYAGRGVEKDYKEAFKWFSKAAEQNYPQAQNYLGWIYAYGRGVEKDDKIAVEWFRKAAEQNYKVAQHWLGKMYTSGRGVEKDVVIAYAWFSIASAESNKDRLAKEMSPEQITEAEVLANEFRQQMETDEN